MTEDSKWSRLKTHRNKKCICSRILKELEAMQND